MEITFLGTGAIEYPLGFCNCDNCKEARKRKGKSIRKRASLLINDDLLIDLGTDVSTSMNMYNKDMGSIKYLLQTHVHTDHFSSDLLYVRSKYTFDKLLNKLEIYAHPNCLKIMSKRISDNEEDKIDLESIEAFNKFNIYCKGVNSGDRFKLDKYNVLCIDCNHDIKQGSLLYVITENNKNILYATDTNELTDKALNQLKGVSLDVVIMDHTFGNTKYSFSHLNEKLFIKQIERLKGINCIKDNTLIYATHISHDGNSYHELMEERAIQNGYNVAYDGLKIVI